MIKTRNESAGHVEDKSSLTFLCSQLDLFALQESQNADIFVCDPKSLITLAIEVETTPRNLIRNIKRNFSNGFHGVLVCSRTPALTSQMVASISRHLDPSESARVLTVNIKDITEMTIKDFMQKLHDQPTINQ